MAGATFCPWYPSHQLCGRSSAADGVKFWFHGLRNCFITVAERGQMPPLSLKKRLVNHARSNNVSESYAADWTVAQLRDPEQSVADRIDALMHGTKTGSSADCGSMTGPASLG